MRRTLPGPDGTLLRVGKKSGSTIEQVQEIVNLAQRGRTWYNTKTRWTVSINSGDRLYDIAHRWFTDEGTDEKPPRQLSARYGRKSNGCIKYIDDDVVPPSANPIDLYYDEKGEREVTVSGHKITVSLKKPENEGPPEGQYRPPTPETIFFHARSRDGQLAVVELLERLAVDTDKRKPALHLLNNWGDWSRRDDLPERTLESVVLARGQMERIEEDVQNFLDQESEYVRRGMPYHRGYMLHGPPGTGKTSVVRALAAHFGLDLWYAPLGDLDKDTKLLGLINQVRPGSILLLEDIDVFHATRSREDEQAGLSMAGLLNALDGVATPHGMITFMTTNDISVIDDAVLRAGRVDLSEEISLPDNDQAARLFNQWYNTKLDPTEVNHIHFKGTTADLTELFKRHLNDAGGALQALYKGVGV